MGHFLDHAGRCGELTEAALRNIQFPGPGKVRGGGEGGRSRDECKCQKAHADISPGRGPELNGREYSVNYEDRRSRTERLSEKPPHVIAIYPGSFDPITNGHLDLIQRGSRMFDRLIVSILRNDAKLPLFSVEERMEMLREVLHVYPNVEIDSFDGLLVDYASARQATVLLRGIRAISDYEYELQMALMNRRLRPDIETVFMMANEAYSFISSRLVKQVFSLGGNIAGLVPASVEARLNNRLPKRNSH
jgi:pantetheine-phosphate adenylyltransferase